MIFPDTSLAGRTGLSACSLMNWTIWLTSTPLLRFMMISGGFAFASAPGVVALSPGWVGVDPVAVAVGVSVSVAVGGTGVGVSVGMSTACSVNWASTV